MLAGLAAAGGRCGFVASVSVGHLVEILFVLILGTSICSRCGLWTPRLAWGGG